MKVKNKVFIVTGAGSGLGQNLSIELISKGARVIGVGPNIESLNETHELISNKEAFRPYVLDVTDFEGIKKFASIAESIFDSVDGLINNAGIIQPFIDVTEVTYEKINQVMNVNFYGTLYLCKELIPIFKKYNQAHIINISSMGSFLPVPGQSIYGASKAAVSLFTEALYAELLDTNIKVTLVLPGAMNTKITENSGVKATVQASKSQEKMLLEPKKAALIIIKAIEKDKFKLYLGKDSKLMHFLTIVNLKFAIKLIKKMIKKMN